MCDLDIVEYLRRKGEVNAAAEIERQLAYQDETAKAWTKLTESQEEEIAQLRSDLELRNQTALDRKEIIGRLEQEIERLRASIGDQQQTFHRVIEEQRAEIAQLRADMANAFELADKAQAEIERLRAALKPFADYADPTGRVPEALPISSGSHMAKRQLRMSDCYNAKRALEQKDT